jgi:hypothetical protein
MRERFFVPAAGSASSRQLRPERIFNAAEWTIIESVVHDQEFFFATWQDCFVMP